MLYAKDKEGYLPTYSDTPKLAKLAKLAKLNDAHKADDAALAAFAIGHTAANLPEH